MNCSSWCPFADFSYLEIIEKSATLPVEHLLCSACTEADSTGRQ